MNTERQKTIAIAAVLFILLAWFFAFATMPLLSRIRSAESEMETIAKSLMPQGASSTGDMLKEIRESKIVLYPRREQMSRIVQFVEEKMKQNGLNISSLKQASDANKVSVELNCSGEYDALVNFLQALKKQDTLLIIDELALVQSDSRLDISIKFSSGYL